MDSLWTHYNRIIKDNGCIALFSVQPFTTKLIASNIKYYRYNWYWIKNNVTGGPFARYQPMRKLEEICIFYKKHPTYNPQGLTKLEKPIKVSSVNKGIYKKMTKFKPYQIYTNYPNHILEFKNENGLHPTQKPVPLLEYLIKTYTNENDLVLDNCMGSGSTGVACKNLKRRFIGIELDKEYFNIAQERIKKA